MKTTAFAVLNNQRWVGTSVALLFFTFLMLGRPATWRVSNPACPSVVGSLGFILVGCLTQVHGKPSWCDVAAPWLRANFLPAELVCARYLAEPFFNYGHLLLAALWTLTGPIQLSPWVRRTAPALHRASGRLMLLSALSVSATILYWEASGHIKEHGLHAWTFYRLLYPIFIGSGIASFLAARQKRYQQHAEWALRHIAAAMPFAWGRMVPTLTSRTLGRLGLLDLSSPVHNYLAFWACAYTSVVFSFWLCESSIRAARAAASAASSGAKANGAAVKAAGTKHD